MKKKWFTGLVSVLLIVVAGFMNCTTASNTGTKWDETFDIVIVGAGIAGPLATLGAYEANPNLKILLIEATGLFGGGAARATGIFNPNLINARNDMDLGRAYWRAYMTNTTGGGHTAATEVTAREYGSYEIPGFPNYPKWEEIIYEARVMYDYLIKPAAQGGVGASDPQYGGYDANGLVTYAPTGEGGGMLMRGIRTAIEAKSDSISLYLNCRGEALIMENGIVAGVRATHNGQSKNIRAKKVILATGGFSGSYEGIAANGATNPAIDDTMRYIKTQANTASDGTGIQMAVDAGGVRLANTLIIGAGIQFTSGMHQAVGRAAPGNPKAANAFYMVTFMGPQPQLTSENFIVVDRDGNRFCDEGVLGIQMRGANSPGSNRMISHNKPPYWLIVPADTAGTASADPQGVPADNPAPRPRGGQGVNAGYQLSAAEIVAALDVAVNLTGEFTNEAFKAGSVAALGTAIGASNLAATVTTYNTIVQAAWNGTANADAEANGGQGKANNLLTNKIISAPGGSYYAVKIYPQTMGSFGGVATNGKCQVLNAANEVIPNLYAVGENANRDLYSINPTYGTTQVGGSSFTHYATMGWIAGSHAAANLNQ
ncbi:MAG: FAD-dependent oxidoreductase [Spirochaetaceae bacterium]|jgi:succinate dehydrogenase/fumarate reductase flavoprotein subunit|nr:FAD-dependent oxidoreductase [Spirochaetaceae bacterium]